MLTTDVCFHLFTFHHVKVVMKSHRIVANLTEAQKQCEQFFKSHNGREIYIIQANIGYWAYLP